MKGFISKGPITGTKKRFKASYSSAKKNMKFVLQLLGFNKASKFHN